MKIIHPDTTILKKIREDKLLFPLFWKQITLEQKGIKAPAKYHTLKTKDGKRYFCAYSSWQEYEKRSGRIGTGTIWLTFHEWKTLFKGRGNKMDGIVIDPNSADIIITKEQIQHWELEEKMKQKVLLPYHRQKDDLLLVMRKSNMAILVKSITKVARRDHNIRAIYLLELVREKETGVLIIVDQIGSRRRSYYSIKRAVHQWKDQRFYIAMVSNEDVELNVLDHLMPVYERFSYVPPVYQNLGRVKVLEVKKMKKGQLLIGCMLIRGTVSVHDHMEILNQEEYVGTLKIGKIWRGKKALKSLTGSEQIFMIQAETRDRSTIEAGYILWKK